jgi:hypothetical protein
VNQWEEQIKADEFNEQLAKEKDDMQTCIRSLQRQSHLTNERINHGNKRAAMLRDLIKDEEVASIAKTQMEGEQKPIGMPNSVKNYSEKLILPI